MILKNDYLNHRITIKQKEFQTQSIVNSKKVSQNIIARGYSTKLANHSLKDDIDFLKVDK